MSRLLLVDPHHPTPSQAAALAHARAHGAPPSLPVRVLAHSPAATEGFFALHEATAKSTLPPALRELLALAVSDVQGCQYCVSLHTLLARKAGVTPAQAQDAQAGRAADPRAQAALRFALALVETRGAVAASELRAAREAGLGEAELIEILTQVLATSFGNFLNRLAQTALDVPAVPLTARERAGGDAQHAASA